MADLIEELGITPQVLYGHFATKRDLFVACYKVAVQYMDDFLKPRFERRGTLRRCRCGTCTRIRASRRSRRTSCPGDWRLAQHDEEARRDLREAYETIFRDTVADFRGMRRCPGDPPFSDELIAHAIMGAFEQMLARASLDDEYSWRESSTTPWGCTWR